MDFNLTNVDVVRVLDSNNLIRSNPSTVLKSVIPSDIQDNIVGSQNFCMD